MLRPAKDFFWFASATGLLTGLLMFLAMGVLTATQQPWPPAFMGQLVSSVIVGILGALGVGVSALGIMDDPAGALVA